MGQQLHQFIGKLKGLNNKAQFKLVNIVNEKRYWIENQNTERLKKGKLSDDTQITNLLFGESTYGTSSYSDGYAGTRYQRGLQTRYVDLSYSGRFYDSIRYKKTEEGGKIVSVDSDKKKVQDIDDRYGDKVLGLTEPQLETLANDAAQDLALFIAQKISD